VDGHADAAQHPHEEKEVGEEGAHGSAEIRRGASTHEGPWRKLTGRVGGPTRRNRSQGDHHREIRRSQSYALVRFTGRFTGREIHRETSRADQEIREHSQYSGGAIERGDEPREEHLSP
jgi:hypothetical protein